MNVKKRLLVLCVTVFLLIGCYTPASARNSQKVLYFDMGFPQGEFKDNLDENSIGVGLYYGLKIGKSPIVLGVDLGIMNYGQDERFESFYDIPDMTVRVVNRYNILQGHVFLRLQPFDNAVFSPYFDVLAGLNYLRAETSVEGDDWDEDDVISTVNFADITFSYGFGGGVMIRLDGNKPGPARRRISGFFLDIRVRYIFGGNAQYLQEGSIVADGQDVIYYYSESKTDLLTFQIGFGAKF
jgi:hypothetical protein